MRMQLAKKQGSYRLEKQFSGLGCWCVKVSLRESLFPNMLGFEF